MQMKYIAAAVLAASLSAGAIAAEKGNEFSVNFDATTTSSDGMDDSKTTMVAASYGKYLTEQFLIQGSVMVNKTDDSDMNTFGIGGKYYFKAGKKSELVPFVSGDYLFGNISGDGFDATFNGIGLAAGVSYFLSEQASIDGKYVIEKTSVTTDFGDYKSTTTGVRIGMTYRF